MLLFNIFLSTSIHLPDFIEIHPELFNHSIGADQLCFFAKAQYPPKELIADLHVSRNDPQPHPEED